MPGRPEGAQPQTPEVEVVTVAQPVVSEAPVPGGRGQHRRARSRSELTSAGDEVRVQVGVRGDGDAKTPGVGGRLQGAQVTTGVHG